MKGKSFAYVFICLMVRNKMFCPKFRFMYALFSFHSVYRSVNRVICEIFVYVVAILNLFTNQMNECTIHSINEIFQLHLHNHSSDAQTLLNVHIHMLGISKPVWQSVSRLISQFQFIRLRRIL